MFVSCISAYLGMCVCVQEECPGKVTGCIVKCWLDLPCMVVVGSMSYFILAWWVCKQKKQD